MTRFEYYQSERGLRVSVNDNLNYVHVQVKIIHCVINHLYLLRPAPLGVTMTPRLETLTLTVVQDWWNAITYATSQYVTK